MKFEIHPERVIRPNCVDFRVEAFEGDKRIAAFYAQHLDPTVGYLRLLQQIAEAAPNCCNDFAVTHSRWAADGTPYNRRCSEWKGYCPHHVGIGFPGYHVGYLNEGEPEQERVFECTYCGCTFPESRSIETDNR